MSVSVTITLDTRRIKQRSGNYPIKLLVTFNGEPRRYQTIYDLTQDEFNKLGPRSTGKFQEIRTRLKEAQYQANKVAQALEPFTFEDFQKAYIFNNPFFHQRKSVQKVVAKSEFRYDRTLYQHRFPIFKQESTDPGTILHATLCYIDKLLQEDRIKTAANYQTTYNCFVRFKGNVNFKEITVNFLNQFENWMVQQDYSKTTIGIYIRQLRTLFNEAIENGIIQREKCYPFGRRRYQIPNGRNVKKSLNIEDVEKLYYYDPQCREEQWAMDFWIFSYLANGINAKDIALLRYRNIQGEYLVFERAKTKNSMKSDPRPISVYISEDIQDIMDRWGNKDKSLTNYIFPVLSYGITPMRQFELIELFIQSINDWMAKIRKKLGIEKKITTYVARHTFSTIMKRSGASTEYIQEALGHTDMKTTQNYLDSFEKEVKREFAKKLMPFKREAGENQRN